MAETKKKKVMIVMERAYWPHPDEAAWLRENAGVTFRNPDNPRLNPEDCPETGFPMDAVRARELVDAGKASYPPQIVEV